MMTLLPRENGFAPGLLPLSLFTKDAQLKAHPAYRLAKSGDKDAALELVLDVAVARLYEYGPRFAPGLVFVAPHAQEATGDNAIPQTLAAVCATMFAGQAETEIVQSDRVYHTGADAMERMATRAQFVGRVQAEAEYVLVDDVISLGGTLAELANFIQLRGGKVKEVLVLVNAGRQTGLAPEKKSVQLLNRRFGNEFFDIFGIKPEALSANEAQYLVGFRSVDEIRNRLAAARQEIDRRLRSKGIASAFKSAALGAFADQALSPAAPLADKPHRT